MLEKIGSISKQIRIMQLIPISLSLERFRQRTEWTETLRSPQQIKSILIKIIFRLALPSM